MRTRTYYRGPDAVVTSEVFVWRTAPPRTFVIRDLRRVGIVRGVSGEGRPRTTGAAAGSAVLAVALWPTVDTPALAGAVFLAVAVPAVAAVAYRGRRPRRWELHATYRGFEVQLYASTDSRVFNQVARALRRAMEDADPHSAADRRVAA
uniref:Uncharacterized protein n=1 Tax=uncultured bacterium BAC AB649/1850 TaxID=1037453 RepID=F6K104_9BACT|nr:hypothetical protein [uncultured bacterium BAC AB649/1850]